MLTFDIGHLKLEANQKLLDHVCTPDAKLLIMDGALASFQKTHVLFCDKHKRTIHTFALHISLESEVFSFDVSVGTN